MKTRVENQLSRIRKSRGVGAADLARRLQVSRQTIYAIEAGSYVPNTEVALGLARELEVTVDDLFSLQKGSEKPAEAISAEVLSATSPVKGQPVRICQVGSRWIGVPVSASPCYMPEADGIIRRTGRANNRASVAVFEGRSSSKATRVGRVRPGCRPSLKHGAEDQRDRDRFRRGLE